MKPQLPAKLDDLEALVRQARARVARRDLPTANVAEHGRLADSLDVASAALKRWLSGGRTPGVQPGYSRTPADGIGRPVETGGYSVYRP